MSQLLSLSAEANGGPIMGKRRTGETEKFEVTEKFEENRGDLVRMKGLEPSLPCGNQNLNLARLPVSPHPHNPRNQRNYNNPPPVTH
jgi:hypothetical protein